MNKSRKPGGRCPEIVLVLVLPLSDLSRTGFCFVTKLCPVQFVTPKFHVNEEVESQAGEVAINHVSHLYITNVLCLLFQSIST